MVKSCASNKKEQIKIYKHKVWCWNTVMTGLLKNTDKTFLKENNNFQFKLKRLNKMVKQMKLYVILIIGLMITSMNFSTKSIRIKDLNLIKQYFKERRNKNTKRNY